MSKQWEILVVDDEEVMRDSMAGWLREDGYAVATAASGRFPRRIFSIPTPAIS